MLQLPALVVTTKVTAPVPLPPVVPSVADWPSPNVVVLGVKLTTNAAWLAGLMVKDCVTCGAAVNAALPGWLAAIVQVPVVTIVTTPLPALTVQTPGVVELYATARLDEAEASGLSVKVPLGA